MMARPAGATTKGLFADDEKVPKLPAGKLLPRPGRDFKARVQDRCPDAIAIVDDRRRLVVIRAGKITLAATPYSVYPSSSVAWKQAAEALG